MQIRPLTNMGRPNWDVDGNEGDVHSYDPATGIFYALVSSGVPMTSPRYVRSESHCCVSALLSCC